jgi:hypothetical protein
LDRDGGGMELGLIYYNGVELLFCFNQSLVDHGSTFDEVMDGIMCRASFPPLICHPALAAGAISPMLKGWNL